MAQIDYLEEDTIIAPKVFRVLLQLSVFRTNNVGNLIDSCCGAFICLTDGIETIRDKVGERRVIDI